MSTQNHLMRARLPLYFVLWGSVISSELARMLLLPRWKMERILPPDNGRVQGQLRVVQTQMLATTICVIDDGRPTGQCDNK
jgi:hypothetical protein